MLHKMLPQLMLEQTLRSLILKLKELLVRRVEGYLTAAVGIPQQFLTSISTINALLFDLAQEPASNSIYKQSYGQIIIQTVNST